MATKEAAVLYSTFRTVAANVDKDVEFPFQTSGYRYHSISVIVFCFGQATDADMPNTVNSQTVYRILPSMYSDNFTIDPNTGVLTESGDLDRESLDSKLQGRVELKVTATDKGTPPLSSNVTVIINIEVSFLQLITICNYCASCRSFLK